MIDIHTLDLRYLGLPEVIAAFLVPCPEGGFVLLECGPASTLAALEEGVAGAGFELRELAAIFVTHVHLDHAAGAGTLSRRTGASVFVHPEGARHLIDPEAKLVPSARRLYGDRMETLWGTMEPVPEDRTVVAEDGDVVVIGGLEVVAHHTPGHAAHHIAWAVGSAVATGDVAGVRLPGASHVLPPMPPPDIDLEAWRESLERLRAVAPELLLVTHFGAFGDCRRHLDDLESRLDRWEETARRTMSSGGGATQVADALRTLDDAEVATAGVPPDTVARYRRLCPFEGNTAGLVRYLDRRDAERS